MSTVTPSIRVTAQQIAREILRATDSGEVKQEAWEVAEEDLWQAVEAWVRPCSPQVALVTGRIAGALFYASAIVWAHTLLDWAGWHIVPCLPKEDSISLLVAIAEFLPNADLGAWQRVYIDLQPWASLAGVSLPDRKALRGY